MDEGPKNDQPQDAWEKIRHLTLDQFVTQVKLVGSGIMLDGFTTPEKWPFVFVLAIASPGNEAAIDLAKNFHAEMQKRAKWTQAAHHPQNASAIHGGTKT